MKRKKNAPGGGASERLREFVNSATDPTPSGPQSKPRRARARNLLIELRAEYPVLGENRPLAIGIHMALRASLPAVGRSTVSRVLAMHCRSDHYLKALAAGGPRFGLDGTRSGEISEEHRAAAVLVLERRAKAGKPPNPLVLPGPLLRLANPGRSA